MVKNFSVSSHKKQQQMPHKNSMDRILYAETIVTWFKEEEKKVSLKSISRDLLIEDQHPLELHQNCHSAQLPTFCLANQPLLCILSWSGNSLMIHNNDWPIPVWHINFWIPRWFFKQRLQAKSYVLDSRECWPYHISLFIFFYKILKVFIKFDWFILWTITNCWCCSYKLLNKFLSTIKTINKITWPIPNLSVSYS